MGKKKQARVFTLIQRGIFKFMMVQKDIFLLLVFFSLL